MSTTTHTSTERTTATDRFATMTAAEVLEEQDRMLARWAAEDALRRARLAAIMGTP